MDKEKNLLYLDEALNKIKNKENKIYFYVANGAGIEGSIGVTYRQAHTLKENGYDVIMLHDNLEYIKPTFLGEELCNIEHLALNKNRNKIKVNVSDIIVYPETHPDVIEKTRALKCMKVVLCQSHSRLLTSMTPGMSWVNMDIDHVITTNDSMKNYINMIFGDTLLVDVITPSVDDTIFRPTETFRLPTISVLSRNQKDILKLAKEFYAMNPSYTMFSFKDMRDLSKKDFADTLSKSFLSVWIDRDSAFPQFPIECAKTETFMVGVVPDMDTDILDNDSGIFTFSTLDLPKIVSEACTRYLNNYTMFTDEIKAGQAKLASGFKLEDEKKDIISVYEKLINRKRIELNNLYNKIKNV